MPTDAPGTNALTRKIGPLPVWAWAGIAVVGILVIRARSKSSSSATPTSADYSSTVPSSYTEPTASIETPSGFSYSGPLSGLQSLIPTGALSSTNGSTSGATNPPAVASPPAPQSSLPPVNAANYPQVVKYGSYSPSDYTQIGTVSNGQYTGQQVGGGVPVYTNIFGGFAQGAFPQSGTYGVYIPSQFTAYEHA